VLSKQWFNVVLRIRIRIRVVICFLPFGLKINKKPAAWCAAGLEFQALFALVHAGLAAPYPRM
jgi:hypothetical protein